MGKLTDKNIRRPRMFGLFETPHQMRHYSLPFSGPSASLPRFPLTNSSQNSDLYHSMDVHGRLDQRMPQSLDVEC